MMTEEELERRVNANLKPLDVKSAQDAADDAFNKPVKPMKLDTVETKPDPELTPTISPVEAIWGWVMGFMKQQDTAQFEGKPVANPFSVVSVLTNWKWLAIGVVVLGVLFALLRWIV